MGNRRLLFTLKDVLRWAEEKPEDEIVVFPEKPAAFALARFLAETNRQQCVKVDHSEESGLVVTHFGEPISVIVGPVSDLITRLDADRAWAGDEILAGEIAAEARTLLDEQAD